METLTTIISFVLLLGMIFTPIILFNRVKKWNRYNYDFLIYIIIGAIITAGITMVFAWWTGYSNKILLSYYGYNFDAMNDTARYWKVNIENIEKVKKLEIGYFGIGWPVKALITFLCYSPYLLIVYLIGQLLKKMKLKRNNKNALQHAAMPHAT